MGGLRLAALLGLFCLPAVSLKYTFALHRLDQQFAERPDQGINAIRRIPRCDPIDVRGKIGHLVFELRKGADVMDAALLVESAATGSARTTLPREARTAVNATLGSTMRSVAPTMSPPLLTSATMRSARCVL